MFSPNNSAQWSASTGSDKFGQKQWAALVSVPCSVVKFVPTIKQTPVRTTESASRMYADEIENASVLLFPKTVPVSVGDMVVIFGASLLCVISQPMLDVFGQLDFYECTFQAQAT